MNCLACNHDALIQHSPLYARCDNCGLIKALTPPTYDLNKYAEFYGNLFDTDLEKRINFNRLATVMRHLPLGSRILDYGCACGNFLARAEDYYECMGYEPSTTSAARKTCRCPVSSDGRFAFLGCGDPETFDMVTMFDVFEHFRNPQETFGIVIDRMIKPGGHVLINTPNPEYVSDPERWYHFKPGEHTYFWTPQALLYFMNRCGYSVVEHGYSECLLRKNDTTIKSLLTMVFKKPMVGAIDVPIN